MTLVVTIFSALSVSLLGTFHNKNPFKRDVSGQIMMTCKYSVELVMGRCEWEFSNIHVCHEQETVYATMQLMKNFS